MHLHRQVEPIQHRRRCAGGDITHQVPHVHGAIVHDIDQRPGDPAALVKRCRDKHASEVAAWQGADESPPVAAVTLHAPGNDSEFRYRTQRLAVGLDLSVLVHRLGRAHARHHPRHPDVDLAQGSQERARPPVLDSAIPSAVRAATTPGVVGVDLPLSYLSLHALQQCPAFGQ
jgi:hypothetical protein